MKIALVTNNYKPYCGGVVSAIDVLAQSLIDQGHQVVIITLDFEGLGDGFEGQVKVVRICSPIRFIYKTNYIAIPWLPNQALMQVISQIKPDIIHAHHPFLLGVAAANAGNKLNIPVVFTYHSQYEKFAHLVPLPQFISTCFVKHRILAYCKKIAGIVAPSASIAQDLINTGCKTKLRVIPSSIMPLYLDTKFKLKLKHDVFELLIVSRFAKEKNISFILDMFKQLVTASDLKINFRLTLVGYGPELANLKKQAYQSLGLSLDQVRFVERPSKAELKQYYELADLFVFASQAETQGLVLAEAMACGTPVVALHGAGQNDLVVNGQTGFLVATSLQMQFAIRQIASDHKLHQAMQHAAYKSGQQYHPRYLTASLVDFYTEIINR